MAGVSRVAHTVNIALINGGESPSRVPSACTVSGLVGCIAGESLQDILGSYQTPRAFTAVSDLRYFLDHPGAVGANFGPGDIKQAHAYDESVDFEEIVKACKVAARFIAQWTSSDCTKNR